MAAYKAGMHTVLIPEENAGSEEVDPVVREHVRFVPAKTLDTVLETALCPKGDTESTVISSTILPTPTACPV